MNELEPLLLDELRREFRRTRPPAKAITPGYQPGIFRLTTPTAVGFRIFWFANPGFTQPLTFQRQDTLFELIELLPLL